MERQFVVVTVASNGVVRAWGNKEGQPFPNRGQAKYLVTKLKEGDNRWKEEGLVDPKITIDYRTCEILGDQPK